VCLSLRPTAANTARSHGAEDKIGPSRGGRGGERYRNQTFSFFVLVSDLGEASIKRWMRSTRDCLTRKVNWVLDLEHQRLCAMGFSHDAVSFIEHRADRSSDCDSSRMAAVRRAVGLGNYTTEECTPQGGSASPLLANVYLHSVFDLWVRLGAEVRARRWSSSVDSQTDHRGLDQDKLIVRSVFRANSPNRMRNFTWN